MSTGVDPPEVIILTNRKVEVHWSNPEHPNGVIVEFKLYKKLRNSPYQLVSSFNPDTFLTVDAGIMPGATYHFMIEVKSAGGATNSSGVFVEIPIETPIGIEAPLEVTAISATQIYVVWSYPPDSHRIDQYKVLLNGGTKDQLEASFLNGTSGTVHHLEPYTVYNVRIQACFDNGCGTGPGKDVRTLEAKPEGQSAPMLTAKGPNLVEINWKAPAKPNGILYQYRIHRRIFPSSSDGLLINVLDGETFSFTNAGPELLPYSEYEYRVTAVNSKGEASSDWAKIRTLEAPPQVMNAPVITTIDAFSLSVRWEAPLSENGIINYYVVEYHRTSNDPTAQYPIKSVTVPHTVQSTSISGLQPYSRYEVRIKAVNSAGEVSSEWVRANTGQAAPDNVGLFDVEKMSNGLSVILRWDEPSQPNGIITNYYIYEEGNTNPISQGLNRAFEFRRLQPFTQYYLMLEACTLGGCTRSPVQVVETAEILPEGQSAPVVGMSNATHVVLTWTPPANSYGKILRYQVVRRTRPRLVKRDTTSYSPETVVYETEDTDKEQYQFIDSNLKPFTNYEYMIKSSNSRGTVESPWQLVQTAQAAPGGVLPPMVSHVPGQHDKLRITWHEPTTLNGILQSYQLQRNTSIPWSFGPNDDRSYTDTMLMAFTFYSYKVTACTAGGCSSSDPTVIRTPETAPFFVNAPQLSTVSSTAIEATWTPPQITNGQIREYRLNVDDVTRYIGLDTMSVVDNLTPFQAYNFVLTACTYGGCQDSSSIVGRPEEAPPAGMRRPVLRVTSATSIEITWQEPEYPNGIITSYEIRRDGTLIYTTTLHQYTDYELLPGKTYTYRVTAFNGQGSTVSPAATATSYPSSPSGMNPPTTQPVSATSIRAEWQEPLQPNGDIHNYTLTADGEVVYAGRGFSHVVDGLEYWTEYSLRIQACTLRGCAISTPTKVRTLEAAPLGMLPPKLTALADRNGAHDGVRVDWAPPRRPNGIITYYDVYRRNSTRLRPGEH